MIASSIDVDVDGPGPVSLVRMEDRVGALEGSISRPRLVRRSPAHPCGDPLRVVIADDELLLREGLARLLTEVGFEVVGKVADPVELARAST